MPSAAGKKKHLMAGDELKSDSKLIIPIPPGKHAATEDGEPYARHTTRYKIRRGDTVFFNDTATTEIYTLSLHYALPISIERGDDLRGRIRCRWKDETANGRPGPYADRKSTRLNSSHANISYAVFCL